MSIQTADEIVDVGEHLPDGATLVIDQISWDDYEYLLEGLADHPHLRISYDCGRLEVVSPSPEHGEYERLIEDFVLMFSEAFHLKLEKRGNATWKRRTLSKGVEPDSSFYLQNAGRIIGRREINLDCDPPPDIVVEIDVTHSSFSRFSIYAALGVSEIWVYDGHVCRFYLLVQSSYEEIPVSRGFSGLTGAMIAACIEISKTQGQDEARKAFRRRIKSLKSRKLSSS